MAKGLFLNAKVVQAQKPAPRKKKVDWSSNPYARAKKAQKNANVLAEANQQLRDQVAKIPLLEAKIAKLTEEVDGLWFLIGELNKERKGR